MFLLVVSAAIFVCCLAIETSTIRLCFGMSRDDALPGSKCLSKVHKGLHTPILSCIVVGLLSRHPDHPVRRRGDHRDRGDGDDLSVSYLIGNLALFRARLRGWPKTKAPFSLGSGACRLTCSPCLAAEACS